MVKTRVTVNSIKSYLSYKVWRTASDLSERGIEADRHFRAVRTEFNKHYLEHGDYIISSERGYRLTRNETEIFEYLHSVHLTRANAHYKAFNEGLKEVGMSKNYHLELNNEGLYAKRKENKVVEQ